MNSMLPVSSEWKGQAFWYHVAYTVTFILRLKQARVVSLNLTGELQCQHTYSKVSPVEFSGVFSPESVHRFAALWYLPLNLMDLNISSFGSINIT